MATVIRPLVVPGEYTRDGKNFVTRGAVAPTRAAPLSKELRAAMDARQYTAYNVAGGVLWVGSLLYAGFFFGNIPLIKENFGLVTIGIVVVSLLPVIIMALRKPAAPAGG